ncbi:polysaccharide pyruvyl transferase family protein [Sphingomonas sp. ACRSK]|uniref:polysaccharide pyruvyl transferase family protein n=1 Tax=Sphingomonas sp. ACRSK TaxID=2918213 RepID=UPI001EF45770|nr:polysaccharide pyruvyl transferase family protein [Sphingomonas sp. ACRSK]MCG7347492.1 polysaccharide pyruvyl transferase family protein [Sphingomonas sp. ACRSK]
MDAMFERVEELAERVRHTVTPLADLSGGYALLDFPDYSNVGDSLIWLGELAFFDRAAAQPPGYVSTIHAFDLDALLRRVPEGPVFLSGGGNFGDLWPRFQQFRRMLLAALPGRPIVQLPQTIHFADPEQVRLTREAIAAHGNFTLLVRDRASLAFAEAELGCPAELCPDMAFCLGSLSRPALPVHDIVYLLRTDQERSAGRGVPELPRDTLLVDWIHGTRAPSRWDRAVARLGRTARMLAGGEPDYRRFRARARSELERGRALLGSGDAVVTDRLHGHILSVLMGIPHAVLDNSYGKVRGFAELWTGDLPGVAVCETLDDATAHALATLREIA